MTRVHAIVIRKQLLDQVNLLEGRLGLGGEFSVESADQRFQTLVPGTVE